MANLSSGDIKGCWYVINRKAALYAAPVVVLAALVHAATGRSNHHFTSSCVGVGVDVCMRTCIWVCVSVCVRALHTACECTRTLMCVYVCVSRV